MVPTASYTQAIIFILFLHPFSPGFVILFLFVFILYGCVRAAHQQRRLLQRSEVGSPGRTVTGGGTGPN